MSIFLHDIDGTAGNPQSHGRQTQSFDFQIPHHAIGCHRHLHGSSMKPSRAQSQTISLATALGLSVRDSASPPQLPSKLAAMKADIVAPIPYSLVSLLFSAWISTVGQLVDWSASPPVARLGGLDGGNPAISGNNSTRSSSASGPLGVSASSPASDDDDGTLGSAPLSSHTLTTINEAT